jgi:lactoylglutathione lyase
MPQIKIEHLAIWTQNLEQLKDFYVTYFGAQANDKYTNPATGFQSYFLSFASGARLELMSRPTVKSSPSVPEYALGLTHLAFSVGSKEHVDGLTAELREAGYKVIGEPRTTGDGYYESLIADPDGNLVEITI